ncbi:alpha/beta hydrolase [Streptomyces sp. RerS4]|uniref:alpha/beta fold hydrolase n=1 Tax=Streptomyces sp. RerS4 TaxID=2942449 RepID=UPI00201C004E|nr:alpha/beta hydrolase [Streptomyces sp. RerS4]UQW99356.1 alpha/beta hydrolase [Streptomyces sp. RerS4]
MPTTAPSVVLVHGGFADTSSWIGVVAELQRHRIPVLAAATPLRGLAHDTAYLSAFLDRIDGPVVLVGHAYGGAVISAAGATARIVGLVYVSSYLPDAGESYADLQDRIGPAPVRDCLQRSPCARADGPSAELTIRADAYPEVFAADVPPDLAEVMAVIQRPVAETTFTDTASVAAWRGKPTWVLIAGADRALSPEIQRFTAHRAGATVREAATASHAVTLSQPGLVADLIIEAVHALSPA